MTTQIRGLTVVIACALAFNAIAQNRQPTPDKQDPVRGVVEFEQDTHKIPSLGLALHIPLGAIVESTRVAERATTRISPESRDWLIDIQPIEESDRELTVAALADRIADRMIESARPGGAGREELTPRIFLREKQVRLPNTTAERFYIIVPQRQGEDLIRGMTLIQLSPTRYAALSIFSRASDFAQARLTYEALVSSIVIEDPETADVSRAAAVRLGMSVLARLDDDDYRQIIADNPERWERFFRPSSTGSNGDAAELGYRRITAWQGKRGDVNYGRPRRHTAADDQPGILLRFESRLVETTRLDGVFTGEPVILDTVATYFMSFDGEEESWLLRVARREGAQTAEWEELGARTGTSMNVRTSGVGRTPSIIKPIFESEGYISQVQSFLLPLLLVRAGIEGDFGFYAYRSADSKVVLRRDVLERPSSNPELWLLRSRLTEDSPEQQWLFDPDGSLIRSTLQDGRIWEPTTLDRLASLWRSKGLPMK